MTPRLILLGAILLGGALIQTACARGDDHADLKPPPGFTPPPVKPLQAHPQYGHLRFGRGFWPMEVGNDGKTWRWMAGRGEIRLQSDHRPRRLRLYGWVPLEFHASPPTVRITLESHLLDSFVASTRGLSREYLIKPEHFNDAPSAVLVIETSATIRAPGDTRDLGISIESVKWEGGP